MRLAHTNMHKFEEYRPYIDTMVLPIGTVEAHGKHAPLGTDILIPKRLADYIEEKLGGRVWTAPEIAYGHCWHLKDFPGTIDVPNRIFADYVHAVVTSFAAWGLKHVVLLNGHGGNAMALNEVASRLADQGLVAMVSNYWVDYQAEIKQIAPGVGHAGEDETSFVMAVDAESVDLSLTGEACNIPMPRGVRYPGIGKATTPDAYSGDPKSASVEKGEALFELVGELLVRDITALWATQV